MECYHKGLTHKVLDENEEDVFVSPSPLGTPFPPITASEGWYDKEIYWASDNVSQGAVLWSSEFGNGGVKHGSSLDFYLAAKKWGLEFIREGDRLQARDTRF